MSGQETTLESRMRDIRTRLFAYRNGVVADQLRKAMPESGYSVVFGLMVPQLGEIARQEGHNSALADALWADRRCRETRLLACWLWNPEDVDEAKARRLMAEVATPEEGDILAFRLLRNLPCAPQLLDIADPDAPLACYTAGILRRHLQAQGRI